MLTSAELYEKIESLRNKKGLSVTQLSDKAGISRATIHSWKKRGTMPKLEILESLCFALEYPISAILYDVDLDKMSGEEMELLSLWSKLDDEQQHAVMAMIKSIIK